ncbi:MAG: sulfite oxidase [Pseudomonadota bacterium]
MSRDQGLSELLRKEEPASPGRRRWLAAAARTVGYAPFAALAPTGLIPVALAETPADTVLATKPGLRLLNDRPLNAETPAHLLADPVTPTERLFVRNNGIPPQNIDAADWQLEIAGESCLSPQTISLDALKREFRSVTLHLQLECGGNGRAEFRPRASGNQWTTGAIGCPEWTGIRLRDVLKKVGVRDDAVYVAYEGADTHLSGDPNKSVISRGVPIAKALEAESLLAYELNGEPIPAVHGAPLRLVCGGWPGSVSGKWLKRLLIRNRVHDGAKMTGTSYRVPCRPVAPGGAVADEDMCIIESMPVKSLITSPASGATAPVGRALTIAGHAWAGDRRVKRVELSTDFGSTWQRVRLDKPANRLAWQHFRGQVVLPVAGYYEVWARATDAAGASQPMLVPGWNPKGYLNNACHRIAVQAV